MPAAEKRFSTGKEYLALERDADFKSEYLRGEIYAMSGASLNHNIIAGNLTRFLGNKLDGRPCRVFVSDMKVQIHTADAYFYPDISGLCGEMEFHDDRRDIYGNPEFVIEILSDSTELYDRGKKFFYYQMLPSLKEYVLVSQNSAVLEVYRKDGDHWIYQLLRNSDAILKLESIGCELTFSEIFRGVDFSLEESVFDPPNIEK